MIKGMMRFWVVLFVVALAGCATTPKRAPESLQAGSRTIAFYPSDGFQSRILYHGPGKAWAQGMGAFVGGAIGGAIAGGAEASPTLSKKEQRIQNALLANGIDIAKLGEQTVVNALSSRFTVVDADQHPDTYAKVSFVYGFYTTNPFNKNVRPAVFTNVILVDKDGKKIWRIPPAQSPFPEPPRDFSESQSLDAWLAGDKELADVTNNLIQYSGTLLKESIEQNFETGDIALGSRGHDT